MHDALAREYGVDALADRRRERLVRVDYHEILVDFFLQTPDHERALDVIEIVFQTTGKLDAAYLYGDPKEAVDELNARFREHGVGYQFESGEIIRVDSQILHEEAVKPALHVLCDRMYKGANDEYLNAHRHYRHGRYKESLTDCLKAFESVMKAICQKRQWQHDPRATAKGLLEVCFANDLIPQALQSHFGSLRAGLESGIPTVRNRLGAHGQGTEIVEVPEYLARYLIHLTATSILLLADAEKSLS